MFPRRCFRDHPDECGSPTPGAVDARTGAAYTAAGATARQRLFVLVIFFFVRSAHFLLPR